MSDLVRTARAMIDAWNDGNVDRMIEFWAEDGDWRWENDPSFPGARTHDGRAAVEAHLREGIDVMGELEIEIEDIRQVDEQVAILARTHVRGVGSGIEFDDRWGHLVTFENGRVRSYAVFVNPDDAFAAVGS